MACCLDTLKCSILIKLFISLKNYSSKCDTEIDCFDKSDEYYCDYLRFGENYARELIPRDDTGQPLIVYINVSVLAFPSIDTVNLKFIADFFLNLKWYDLRVDFRDLNNVTSLNSLSKTDQEAIWTPKLGFSNALGPFQVGYVVKSKSYLVKILPGNQFFGKILMCDHMAMHYNDF